jgi:ADP-heptose:LPS heptosyltransferase
VLGDVQHLITFLIPDAGMAIKHWPPASFVTLGRALRQRYDATVIIPIGSDADLAEGIAGEIGGTACIWPRGSLCGLATAMDGADLAVGADTGVARIAAALKVTTITLFGPSWYGRYGQPAPHLNLQGFAECSERVIKDLTIQRCWYSGVCPIASWGTCLESISPHDVLSAAASFLEDQVPGRRRRLRDTRRVDEWGMEIQTGHYVE